DLDVRRVLDEDAVLEVAETRVGSVCQLIHAELVALDPDVCDYVRRVADNGNAVSIRADDVLGVGTATTHRNVGRRGQGAVKADENTIQHVAELRIELSRQAADRPQ